MNRLRRIATFALVGFIGTGFFVWTRRHHAVRGDGRNQNHGSPLPPGTHTHSPYVTGTVVMNDQRLAGAVVKVMDQPDTQVTTGSNGDFSFRLPVDSTQLIRMTHPHTWIVQSTVVVGASNLSLEGIDDTDRAQRFAAVNQTENPSRGIILVRFAPLGRRYRATLSVPGGVLFAGTEQGLRRQDTTTTTDGQLIFVNIPSGPVTVTPVPPSGTCRPTFGTATTRVDPLVMTLMSFDCN